MSELSVRLEQPNLIWENRDANLDYLEKRIQSNDKHTDIIILPEMFTSGFSMNAEVLSEEMEGVSVNWMLRLAKARNSVICGSLNIKENEKYFNRLIWAQPDGQLKTYDKRHLFSLAEEEKHFSPGTERLIIEYKGWKICPLICYDLRFPVWSRNDCDYDLLIYVANWPSERAHAWRNLLISRAIENQCYTIGVNRVGQDGNDLKYLGDSVAIDYNGLILKSETDIEASIFANLDREKMLAFREKLSFLADRDSFSVHV